MVSREGAFAVRARAIAAATKLFAERGFEGTSVQAVADVIGVSKQAVLHHFESKERLREAVLDAIVAHWHEVLPRLVLAVAEANGSKGDRDERAARRHDAVFGELMRFFGKHPDRAKVMLREGLDRPAETRRLLEGSVGQLLEIVAAQIDRGRAKGPHYADVDATAYALHMLLFVLVGAAAGSSVVAHLVDRKRFDAELVRIARASLFDSSRRSKSVGASKRSRSARRAQPHSHRQVKST